MKFDAEYFGYNHVINISTWLKRNLDYDNSKMVDKILFDAEHFRHQPWK